MTRKKYSLILLAVGIMAVALLAGCINDPCCNNSSDFEASEPFDREVALAGHNSLRIEGINGPIEIIGVADANVVEIWGEKTACATSQNLADSLLEDIEIRITAAGELVHVQTIQPDDSSDHDFSVVYHIRIPQSWTVEVQHINGSVSVSACDNSVDIHLINGDTNLTNLSGNLGVQVVNGQVNAGVSLVTADTCQINLTNGTIMLTIPSTISAVFSATVINGAVQISGLEIGDWLVSPTSASGTLGNGDASVILHATNGAIVVNGV